MAVYTWGFGKYGQLGTGQITNSELPQEVKLPSQSTPLKVSCGAHFTLVLCTSRKKGTKRLFACGWGKYGRLGVGSEDDHVIPADLILDPSVDVVEVSAGHWHACCIATDGTLYSWGYNKSHSVLGLSGSSVSTVVVPTRITSPQIQFKAVFCGYNYTYAISDEGTCFSWGSGNHGVTGHGSKDDYVQPTIVEAVKDKTFKHVGCGYSHAALVEVSGMLYTVGNGEDGALGHGKDKRDKLVPTVVDALAGVEIASASCSQGEHHGHTLACASNGEVYSCGDGYKGKLGHGNQESFDTPTRIDPKHFLEGRVVQVACGGIHSSAMTENGCVFTWGCGSDGRLGHPEAKGHRYLFRSDVPRIVEGIPRNVTDISCSYYHSAAVSCPSKTME